jgi:hypothetical protein
VGVFLKRGAEQQQTRKRQDRAAATRGGGVKKKGTAAVQCSTRYDGEGRIGNNQGEKKHTDKQSRW